MIRYIQLHPLARIRIEDLPHAGQPCPAYAVFGECQGQSDIESMDPNVYTSTVELAAAIRDMENRLRDAVLSMIPPEQYLSNMGAV